MSGENNIKNFTAADIEKYWAGKLSSSEMHAIEKAAMDDPFLADALEGYRNTTTVATDLDVLQEKLDKRVIAFAPVIPLKQKRFPWLKIAAAVIILGGIGVLVQQLVFNDQKQNSIVSLNKDEKAKDEVATTNNQTIAVTPGTQGDITVTLPDSPSIKTQQRVLRNGNAITSQTFTNADTTNISSGELARNYKEAEAVKIDSATRTSVAAANAEVPIDKLEKKSFDRDTDDSAKKRFEFYDAAKPNAKFMASGNVSQGFGMTLNNKYNYRVVDAQNNPVPFANVMNTRDNVGTYTDIRGNFILVSSDRVLNVQVKSLGYLSNNYKLVPSSQINQLVLKEDYYARRQILVDSNRQLVSNVTRKDTAELEEPEVGWPYFNTYVANNIQIPDNIRKKNALGNVELSFDVDKAGNPINIKVTKSSQCKECDDEAIRLLKEGPKWKKKGRRSKTTISIAVDQK